MICPLVTSQLPADRFSYGNINVGSTNLEKYILVSNILQSSAGVAKSAI